MTEITASLVKKLRDTTGAGMMDCKKALVETGGDIEVAVDWLRKKGISAAAKKADRAATEGLVGVATGARKGAVVEVNAETDFVARNDLFQEFVRSVAGVALEGTGDLEAIKAAKATEGEVSIGERVTQLVATIGENLSLRRSAVLEVVNGVVTSYVHNAAAPGLGRIGVLVALESEADEQGLAELGKKIAMHVAASAPQAVSRDDVEAGALARERSVLEEQARASGRPDDIVAKMVEGRLRRFFEEACLLEQIFVIDGETPVGEVLEAAAKEFGTAVHVKGFVRFVLGEGLDRKDDDFAAEVTALSS
ncbi:MAG: translation elongation factor Ts [Rhodospirillales bacterium]|jgi:elongation factor Ts|nr:translation elongation factor Ts [Rhodospirillales bacterium]